MMALFVVLALKRLTIALSRTHRPSPEPIKRARPASERQVGRTFFAAKDEPDRSALNTAISAADVLR